jgi:hypothetical protein
MIVFSLDESSDERPAWKPPRSIDLSIQIIQEKHPGVKVMSLKTSGYTIVILETISYRHS